MTLNFKKATISDVPTITTLASKIWHLHYATIITEEQIDYMLQTRYSNAAIEDGIKQGEQFYIVEYGGEAIAYASFELKLDGYYLNKFYIDVSRHRVGIGTQLFNFITTKLDTNKALRLQVNRQNYKAINFYFKMGFVIETVANFDIGNNYYMNDFVMIRTHNSLPF